MKRKLKHNPWDDVVLRSGAAVCGYCGKVYDPNMDICDHTSDDVRPKGQEEPVKRRKKATRPPVRTIRDLKLCFDNLQGHFHSLEDDLAGLQREVVRPKDEDRATLARLNAKVNGLTHANKALRKELDALKAFHASVRGDLLALARDQEAIKARLALDEPLVTRRPTHPDNA